MTEISVEIQKKNPILPYKWLFWWVFNFLFLREDVKCAKKVHELLFHVQIVKQVIYFLPLKNGPSGSLTHYYQLGALLLRKRVKCHSPIQ